MSERLLWQQKISFSGSFGWSDRVSVHFEENIEKNAHTYQRKAIMKLFITLSRIFVETWKSNIEKK